MHLEPQSYKKLIANIKELLNAADINVVELSNLTSIPKGTLYNLLSELHEPRLSLVQTLGKFFNLNISQLIGELPLTLKEIPIPIFFWDNLQYKDGKINFAASSLPQFTCSKLRNNNPLFAISIEKDVYPKYEEGTILIFEESRSFVKGDIVLISQEKTKSVLKTVLIEGKETYLKSVANDIPAQIYDPQNTVIFGVLREIRMNKF
ncbi:MAG: S24 family peptidase [Janthinobacterium lividum]